MFVAYRLVAVALAGAVVSAVFPGTAWVAFLSVNGALAVAVAFDVLRAPAPSRMRITREAPPVLTMGRTGVATLRLHNPARRPARIAVRDASPPSLRRDPTRHDTRLGPGEWASFSSDVNPSRRGRMILGPVTVRAAGPLGIAGRQATIRLHDRLKVYPALPSRSQVELRLERARLLQSGDRSSAVRGGGTEFDTLREYHPDDEFRRINWRATARAAKPITNLYREERNQHVMILLDAGRAMAPNVEGVSRFEHALDAGYAVAQLASWVGDHVGMVTFGAEIIAMLPPRSGRSQPRRIIDALFATEPSLDAANYQEAFAGLLSRHRRRALLVLLTDLVEESAMESLFVALPALLRRHLVIVGSVLDAQLARSASSVPDSSEEAYLKAAAAGALASREASARRMRRMGVVVVDRAPHELAGALADQYLRIKAFGRL